MRADLQRLKDELAEHNRSLSELRTELKKVRTEHTNFILELSRLNADRADEIKSLQARVTKLEGKVIF
jgi:predicted  nucleic acid-binding Zn-ribbon protein